MSPESNRKILLFMVDELEKPLPWLDPQAALIRKHAIQWALDQTQEPAPPPGGWPKEFRSPEGAIRFIEQTLYRASVLSASPSASAMILALEWALPILRRVAYIAPAATPHHHEDPVMTIENLLEELNCLGIPGEAVIDPKIIYTSPTGRRLYITRHHLEGGIENWPLPGKYEVRLGDRTIYGEHIEISELLGKEPAPAKRKR